MFEYVDPELARQLADPQRRGRAARAIGMRGLVALARNPYESTPPA